MDLKRCPFCGGAAECADLEYDAETVEEEREPCWQAGCGDCGVYTMPALTAEEVAEIWNTRRSPLSQETVDEIRDRIESYQTVKEWGLADWCYEARKSTQLLVDILTEIEGKQS